MSLSLKISNDARKLHYYIFMQMYNYIFNELYIYIIISLHYVVKINKK
ncbi:hypothetical protein BACCOPRO_01610 [Phocaeicola coprophilus DSM 18228 = JCM 13818]|uniref:Uncharacterized protein n=1 Tax=Phocaeicola coprophilus DSM 18228 = JCM 13818 TaxID=547042 RepID=S0F711_9BACT|nr:hypothetical protein BACCOPRO_01610 [Phocaeicola coprophilus DSM 18228 = JCM 13818]